MMINETSCLTNNIQFVDCTFWILIPCPCMPFFLKWQQKNMYCCLHCIRNCRCQVGLYCCF
uniref:Uncharacterized protein n=1 Tax=Arundo donax TaxID=35708 RepID=A0A0A9EN65_ARUDO